MRGGTIINAHWIRARLKELGKTQKGWADSLGLAPARIVELLDGERELHADEVDITAEFLEIARDDVFTLFGLSQSGQGYGRLLVRGYVDATSGTVVMRADIAGGELEEIDAPFPGYRGCLLRIKGTSMAPRYREGEVVGFTRDVADIHDLLNEEVIAETEDGRLLLKVLHRGSQPEVYTLVSLSPDDPPIVNIGLRWAARVDFHLPRRW